MEEFKAKIAEALGLLAQSCPRLARTCYWAGTSALAMEELRHRSSLDLDFHTREALLDVRPILAEMQAALADGFSLVQAPDSLGSAFRGVMELPSGGTIVIEVMANYEDVPPGDLVASKTEPTFRRVSVKRYLADKIQCVAERVEARDLVDVAAVLDRYPELEPQAREYLGQQDALIMAERLLAWTQAEIAEDLAAYPEVDPQIARSTRYMLLGWLKHDPETP